MGGKNHHKTITRPSQNHHKTIKNHQKPSKNHQKPSKKPSFFDGLKPSLTWNILMVSIFHVFKKLTKTGKTITHQINHHSPHHCNHHPDHHPHHHPTIIETITKTITQLSSIPSHKQLFNPSPTQSSPAHQQRTFI